MGWNDFFKRGGNEKAPEASSSGGFLSHSKTEQPLAPKNPLLLSFLVSAGATVLVPLFIWMMARLFGGDNEGDNGDNNNGWWQRWRNNDGEGGEGGGWWPWSRNDNAEEGQGSAALGFVYVWSLLLFGGIVWYGSQLLKQRKRENYKVLFAALIVFTNLALLIAILVGGLGVSMEGREMEERGWMGQFPAAMVLMFCFWTVFGIVFSFILYGKTFGRSNKHNDSTTGFYRRHEDSQLV